MCTHFWLIDRYNFGVCKKCGEKKQFEIAGALG
jgi:hypothetical protein